MNPGLRNAIVELLTFTTVGLALDAIGVVLLFSFAPERFADPQWSAFFRVEGESAKKREHWKKMQPVRKWISRLAVAMIVIGFLLQIWGEIEIPR